MAATYRDRDVAPLLGPVAKIAELIGSPAVGPTYGGEATRVPSPGLDHEEAVTARDGQGPVGAGVGPVPQGTLGVESPTVRPVVGGHAAAVSPAGAHLAELEPADDGRRPGLERIGAVPKGSVVVPVTVAAPAVGQVAGRDPAGVERHAGAHASKHERGGRGDDEGGWCAGLGEVCGDRILAAGRGAQAESREQQQHDELAMG